MYRTCFRPTPSGHLHLGHTLVAYHNYQLAHSKGSEFVLMIDDVHYNLSLMYDDIAAPRVASIEEYENAFLEDLEWLGLMPDRIMRCSEHSAFHDEWAEKLGIGKPEPVMGKDSAWYYPGHGLRSFKAMGRAYWSYHPWKILGWATDEHREKIAGGAWGNDLIQSAALYHWFRVLIGGMGPGLEFLPTVGRMIDGVFLAQHSSIPAQADFVRDLRAMGYSADDVINGVMEASMAGLGSEAVVPDSVLNTHRVTMREGIVETHEDGPASV